MARTFNYPIFKTESLDDLPFEQYKVLIKIIDQMNKEALDTKSEFSPEPMPTYTNGGMVQHNKKKGKTVRIINDDHE